VSGGNQVGTLPLAAAAERLRRPPGRPRKAAEVKSTLAPQAPALTSAPLSTRAGGTGVPAVCPILPRLLDLNSAARYLAVSPWTVRDLEAGGVLARVRVQLPDGGELRKLLFDREDLDRLVARWKDHPLANV